MGNVNTIGGGVYKVHALVYVGCVWVVFFCWFVLKFAVEFDTLNLAFVLVEVWGHADAPIHAVTKGWASYLGATSTVDWKEPAVL
jgi:hypothetical protein